MTSTAPPADASAWLLERYEGTPAPQGVHVARPILELIDDHDHDCSEPFWSGSAQWPKPFLYADLDDRDDDDPGA